MGEIAVRLLKEDSWQDYCNVRLAALRESPQAFLATYAEEAMQPKQYWRHCMVRADRLLAESDGAPLGVASVDIDEEAADSASLTDFGSHQRCATPGSRRTWSKLPPIKPFSAAVRSFTTGSAPKTARHRVRQQRRLPGDVAASNRPY
jgi:hypothetical protein